MGESTTALEYISGASDRKANTEHRQKIICCKTLTYRMRKIKHKGAILILIWSYLVISVFHYFARSHLRYQLLAGGVALLFAGWLADVYLGRYKVMCLSTFLIWAGSVMLIASSVTAQLVDGYGRINSYVTNVCVVVMAVGLGGFQANVIQFGIDQLHIMMLQRQK